MTTNLVFGSPDGDRVVFGPLEVTASGRSPHGRVNFVAADVELWQRGHCTARQTDRTGIEALALRHLRDALREILRTGQGTAYFGDHDFYEIVTLAARLDGTVAVQANLPNEDLWEVPLSPMGREDIAAAVDVIDSVEAAFGDLVGYCAGCGVPPVTYRPG